MGIRDDLLREEEITPTEVDKLLIHAQKLFEHEEQGKGQKSLIVDPEDIPLKFIDQALEELLKTKELELQHARDEADRMDREAKQRRRKLMFFTLGTILLIMSICIIAAYMGRASIDNRYLHVQRTQAVVDAELERHEIIQQRFHDVGGDRRNELDDMYQAFQNTRGSTNRLQAAIVHELAMIRTLRSLRADMIEHSTPVSTTMIEKRDDLEIDLTLSIQNIQEAKSLIGQAETSWRNETTTFTGWMALVLGVSPDTL